MSKKKSQNFKIMKKLKPCDCKDIEDTKKLSEQGISFNEDSLIVEPNKVILKLGHVTVNISMHRFKQFAEWYLTEQEIK
jgi:hypothetical protein